MSESYRGEEAMAKVAAGRLAPAGVGGRLSRPTHTELLRERKAGLEA